LIVDPKNIYIQSKAKNTKIANEIIGKFPHANLIEVASHWNIPQLHGNSELASKWFSVKKETLVIGALSSMSFKENGRSTDYISPSLANGCAMACNYCYVARRKGYANPITVFANTEKIFSSIERHASKMGPKTPNQCDPEYWTYDIGCNNDVSVDALISSSPMQTISLFRNIPNAKASFATKYVNKEMLSYDPQRKTRIRFSLMPQKISTLVDVRTSLIRNRIAAINEFYDAGYEVHVNFAPVIVYNGWEEDYILLFEELADSVNEDAKRQLKAEVIFLTHNQNLHELNKTFHPLGEKLLWRPDIQEIKTSQFGGQNLRYNWRYKKELINTFKSLVNQYIPFIDIRYIF
jgi:spore photoproduct lyase family protein